MWDMREYTFSSWISSFEMVFNTTLYCTLGSQEFLYRSLPAPNPSHQVLGVLFPALLVFLAPFLQCLVWRTLSNLPNLLALFLSLHPDQVKIISMSTSPCSREYKMITSCSYSKHYFSSLYCPQPHLHELHLLYISSRNGPTLKLVVQKVLNFWTSVVTIPMFLIRNNWTHNWHIPPWTTNKLLTVIWEQQQTSWWQKNALLYLLIRTVHLFSLSCSQPLVSALG